MSRAPVTMPCNMPASAVRRLAKELVLDAVDVEFANQFTGPMEGDDDPDIRDEMLRQRNRVARFLGLPEIERIVPKPRDG